MTIREFRRQLALLAVDMEYHGRVRDIQVVTKDGVIYDIVEIQQDGDDIEILVEKAP